MAFRSMQGICTSPHTGSQVSPRLYHFLYCTAAVGLHFQQVEAAWQAGERNQCLVAAGFHLPHQLPGGVEEGDAAHLLTAGHVELLRSGVGGYFDIAVK